MRTLLRGLAINFFTIWFFGQVFPGVKIEGGYLTIFWAAVALGLIDLLVKPVLNLLLLPVNLLTLGSFRWLVNVLGLFLLTVFVPGLGIIAFNFSGFSEAGFIVPAFYVSLLFSYILGSFIISLINTFIYWLIK